MPTITRPEDIPCGHAAELAVRDHLAAKIIELQQRNTELERQLAGMDAIWAASQP